MGFHPIGEIKLQLEGHVLSMNQSKGIRDHMASGSDSLITLVYCRDILAPGTARVNNGPGYPQSGQTIQDPHGRPSDLCCSPSFDKYPLFFFSF